MANAGFQNYRPRRTFWYIETNVVLRRPPTPISKLLFEPYLLHYLFDDKQMCVVLASGGKIDNCSNRYTERPLWF